MPRKRSKKRAACAILRCTRRPEILELCRRHAIAEADSLFSTSIRQRDQRCTNCGTTALDTLQCSHHVTRARYWTRWSPENAVAHCGPCHFRFTNHPALHHEWIIERLGAEGWEALMDAAYGARGENGREPVKVFTRHDLAEVLTRLRKEAGGPAPWVAELSLRVVKS